tara:strand:+ start:437 stop:835 length:399 start_codon:yes stop_codon:yes gene_type:complete
MLSKNIKLILLLFIGILAAYIIFDSTSQPNIADLKGGFKEIALYRNANNTGPIIRIYAVSSQNPSEAEVQAYGDLMPYTKYGETTVYFFNENGPLPTELTAGSQNFADSIKSNCFAVYKKDANGQVEVGDRL